LEKSPPRKERTQERLMSLDQWGWLLFANFILLMLLLDLGVFHRKDHEVKFKEALAWSIVWILLAIAFSGFVYHNRGADDAVLFVTGYLLELSLSIDNLFVFLLIFHYFQVASRYQHRVLFWGIFGALVMRAIFIATGKTLLDEFHWMTYVFGVFLVFTGIKLAFDKDKKIEPNKNPVIRLFRRFVSVTPEFRGGKFFVREAGKTLATPLFIVLIVVETTDLIFAVDSIPLILGITTDPFIVYTSNVFAIMGLRSMYFALSGLMAMFHHLHYGLALILVLVGIKMLAKAWDFDVEPSVTLGVVAAILAASITLSLLLPAPRKKTHPASEPLATPGPDAAPPAAASSEAKSLP
jgi:tellurite resistance protein TerC